MIKAVPSPDAGDAPHPFSKYTAAIFNRLKVLIYWPYFCQLGDAALLSTFKIYFSFYGSFLTWEHCIFLFRDSQLHKPSA